MTIENIDWLSEHSTSRLRNAISFKHVKGPLFSTHFMNKIINRSVDSGASTIPSLNKLNATLRFSCLNSEIRGQKMNGKVKTRLCAIVWSSKGSRNTTKDATYTEYCK